MKNEYFKIGMGYLRERCGRWRLKLKEITEWLELMKQERETSLEMRKIRAEMRQILEGMLEREATQRTGLLPKRF